MNVWILLGLGVICAILAWFLLQKSMGRFTYENFCNKNRYKWF